MRDPRGRWGILVFGERDAFWGGGMGGRIGGYNGKGRVGVEKVTSCCL